jgi:branched-chain amino acid transport system ATP-binding protein
LAASLRIADLDAGYGAVSVLRGVTLDVREGETVALLGTNGNGKSTLMKCIMGMVRPSAGAIEVEIDGARVNLIGMTTEAIVDLGIGFVPEGRRLFPRLTVTENLLMGAFRKIARPQIDRNLAFCFELFPRLAERRKQLAGSMSGGEQQMLALARALMSAPKMLLIDEPSVGLAPLLVARTIDSIKALKEGYQLSVLMAEQNFTQAIRIADRGYVIVHGRIEFEGKSAEDLNNNDIIRALYMGA